MKLADRLRSILNAENPDQVIDKALEELWHEHRGKEDKLLTIASEAISFYVHQQNQKGVMRWLKQIGTLKAPNLLELLRIEDRIANSTYDEIILEETSGILKMSFDQLKKKPDSVLKSLVYASLAEINLKMGKIDEAEAQLKNSLKNEERLHENPYLHSTVYRMYSEIMLKKRDYDEAFSMVLNIFKHEPWTLDAEETKHRFKNKVRVPLTQIRQAIEQARKKDEEKTKRAGASVVKFRTADNIVLTASFFKPTKPKSPVAILFPSGGNSRQEHNALAKRLTLEGFAVLSVDMRGHGLSISRSVPNFSFLTRSEKGRPLLTKIYEDGKAAVKYLAWRKDVDSNKVAMLGSSLSGAIPLPAALDCSQVKAAILLSPSIRFWEDIMHRALEDREDLKTLLIVSEEDRSFMQNVERLFCAADKKRTRKIVLKGAAHGTEMLKQHPQLTEIIVKWLKEQLAMAVKSGV